MNLIHRQLKIVNIAIHIVPVVLMEQNQLEVQVHSAARHFDVAANVGVKDSGSVRIVHQCFQILFLEKETCRSTVIDVKCGQSDEVRLGRVELDKSAFCEV
jgi:hypothetical protein